MRVSSASALRSMHHAGQGTHASMSAWIIHHAMQLNACLVTMTAHSADGMLAMDDVMPLDGQQAHALRAMASLRGRSSATRHTAHLAARPDRARAHVQRGTAVRTVPQVG